jgi:hypothetical protein
MTLSIIMKTATLSLLTLSIMTHGSCGECRFSECRNATLSILSIMLSVIIGIVIMLSVMVMAQARG